MKLWFLRMCNFYTKLLYNSFSIHIDKNILATHPVMKYKVYFWFVWNEVWAINHDKNSFIYICSSSGMPNGPANLTNFNIPTPQNEKMVQINYFALFLKCPLSDQPWYFFLNLTVCNFYQISVPFQNLRKSWI